MAKNAVFITGSPSPTSRSSTVLGAVRARLEGLGYQTRSYGAGDFDPRAVLEAKTDDAAVQRYLKEVSEASVVVVSTPVYKASYSGVLKALLDLIGYEALVGRVALGIATGRQQAHLAATGHALGAVFDFFRVGVIVPPLLLADETVYALDEGTTLSAATRAAVDERVAAIVAAVGDRS